MMSSIFDRQFAQSGFPQMLQTFGETVVYHSATGGSRELKAIIERQPPAFYGIGGEVVQVAFILRFKHDCEKGLLANEVDTGGDEVELRYEVGDAMLSRRVVERMLSQDSHVVVLGVR